MSSKLKCTPSSHRLTTMQCNGTNQKELQTNQRPTNINRGEQNLPYSRQPLVSITKMYFLHQVTIQELSEDMLTFCQSPDSAIPKSPTKFWRGSIFGVLFG